MSDQNQTKTCAVAAPNKPQTGATTKNSTKGVSAAKPQHSSPLALAVASSTCNSRHIAIPIAAGPAAPITKPQKRARKLEVNGARLVDSIATGFAGIPVLCEETRLLPFAREAGCAWLPRCGSKKPGFSD